MLVRLSLLTLLLCVSASPAYSALELRYRVSIFGLPTSISTTITVEHLESNVVRMTQVVKSFFVKNHHTVEFDVSDCQVKLLRARNSGRVRLVRWKFDDHIDIDWNKGLITHQSLKAKTSHGIKVSQETVERTFGDKLSQYAALNCHFSNLNKETIDTYPPIEINYIDELISPFIFTAQNFESVKTPAGKFETVFATVQPASEKTSANLPQTAEYWLAPELDFYPVKIKSKSRGVWFTVTLLDYSVQE